MSSSSSRVVANTPKPTQRKVPTLTDSPGTWRHPRLDEIARRQNQATFTTANIRKIMYNTGVILALWLSKVVLRMFISPQLLPQSALSTASWLWVISLVLPSINLVVATRPLWWKQDDLGDIPLTAAQRKLLNLPPTPGAATPQAISTPPRYSRTPSMSGSVGSRASFASSPLSGRGSPAVLGNLSGSPYSPLGSPLVQKSFSPAGNGNRRSSVGSPAAIGAGTAAGIFAEPATPSPSAGKRMSVGLNSKWLYEKGRRSSGGTWLH